MQQEIVIGLKIGLRSYNSLFGNDIGPESDQWSDSGKSPIDESGQELMPWIYVILFSKIRGKAN